MQSPDTNSEHIAALQRYTPPHQVLQTIRNNQRAAIITVASLAIFLIQFAFIVRNIAIGQQQALGYEIALATIAAIAGIASRFKPGSSAPAHALLGALLSTTLIMSVIEQSTIDYLSWWGATVIISSFIFERPATQYAWSAAHLFTVAASTFLVNAEPLSYESLYIIGSFAVICLATGYVAHQRQYLLAQVRSTSHQMTTAHQRLAEVSAIESAFIANRDPHQIMSTAMDILLTVTSSRYGFIGEIRPQPGQESTLDVWGLATDGKIRLTDSNPETLFDARKLGPVILNSCQARQSLILNGITRELSTAELPGNPKLHNLICIPVHSGDTLLGLVALGDKPASFGQEELDNLLPLTRSLGIIIAALRDRDNRRLSEEVLQHSQRIDALGELTGGVAHDFNNILTVQLGNIELLEMHARGLSDNSHLQAVKDAIEHGRTLTSQLLAFSRRQALAAESIRLPELLKTMKQMFDRTLGAAIETQLSLDPNLWNIRADRHQLEGALLNLALNARDAMPSGGKLSLVAGNETLRENTASTLGLAPGNYVNLQIIDTGEGMSEVVRQKVFEPFYTTKDNGKGSGLGLSMVFGFVTQSGGHIAIDSSPGAGTRITLRLPQSLEPVYEKQPAVTEKPTPAHPAASASRRILIIEDEEQVLQVMADLIRDMGFEVFEAIDGKSALDAFKAHAPIDLILSDVMLPHGMSGLDVADIIHKDNPEQRFLFTSGYTGEGLLESRDIDLEKHFIKKPFRTRELLEKIEHLVTS